MFSFIYSTVIDPLLRDIRIYAPEFSGMKAGDTVLDVCCGTGAQAIHYAKRGIIATGIDLGQGMIELAERSKRKQGLRNVSFQIADALNLPFENNFFDYASISLALHEVERTARDRIISEMKRVIKKEGALIFTDFRVPLPKNLALYLIKSIEFIAGRNHFRCFKDYIEQGGLDELLRKNQLPEEKRDYLNNGLIVIIKARNV
jgi:ubiquinone/menaquinone biosynthesis C-methylase UbiE